MSKKHGVILRNVNAGAKVDIADVRRQKSLIEIGALQSAIFNSANFSSIATDESVNNPKKWH